MDNSDYKLKHIDQLRGVAILLVILVHVCQSQLNIKPILYCASDFGKIGVQLFFFLSAYTLCLSYNNRKDPSVTNFYIRRYFRIAPLYYAGILIYLIVSGLPALNLKTALSHRESYTIFNVLSNIFFVHGFVPSANNTIVPGGWSIGTEMIFYLVFPGVYLLFSKLKNLNYVVIVPFLMFLVANAFALIVNFSGGKAFTDLFYYYFILNQFPVFAVGITYFFLEKGGYISLSKFSCIVCFSVLITSSFLIMYKLANNISLSIFLAGLSFCFLFTFFKKSQFRIPILSRIGQLSFSIYIFHFLFAWPLSSWLVAFLSDKLHTYLVYIVCYVVTVGISVVVASISERLIESPGIDLGKKIIKKRNAQRILARSV